MIYLDKEKIVIKQYSQLLVLDSSLILIKAQDQLVKIIGQNFIVLYFSTHEIHISGKVKEVKFDEN
ncbi:MAG: hypothetical protein KHY88_00095 [Erysipelotrichaceae bacterium]|nr:hypothetical protein [Erysipelotrichaceae bacterium]